MAVGQQRGAGLYVGPHESFERGRRIVRYHSEADATGTRIEIFRVLASWPGLIGVAIDHLDGPDDEDFASIAGLEECVALAEGDFRLIDFNDPFERFSVWVDHRSSQLLRQQPSRPVSEAELILKLPRRHAVRMCRHQMRGPEPRRQRKPGMRHGLLRHLAAVIEPQPEVLK